MITVSIVSHGHGELIPPLLDELARCAEVTSILLTLNVPEPVPAIPAALAQRCTVISNPSPLGFGANHNQAFQRSGTPFFCILNPDIRLPENPFPPLLDALHSQGCVLAAPAVVGPQGSIEDSARRVPTPWGLALKLARISDGRYRYALGGKRFSPDWVGGMFMLVRSEAFAEAGGFDEAYFLYYEDVDLCARLTLAGGKLLLCPDAKVIHDARRASHRNLRFLRWHLASMLRFFSSPAFWRLWWRKRWAA